MPSLLGPRSGASATCRSDGEPSARWRELGAAFDGDGNLREEEAVIDELIRDTALTGVIDENTSLATLRETGWARVQGNGCLPIGRWLGSPITTDETFCALRWHVEGGMPYATTTGRATFYVDHPWFLEAGEELPVHKAPPAIGGDHPFVLTGGHPRWSMHATQRHQPAHVGDHPGASDPRHAPRRCRPTWASTTTTGWRWATTWVRSG